MPNFRPKRPITGSEEQTEGKGKSGKRFYEDTLENFLRLGGRRVEKLSVRKEMEKFSRVRIAESDPAPLHK